MIITVIPSMLCFPYFPNVSYPFPWYFLVFSLVFLPLPLIPLFLILDFWGSNYCVGVVRKIYMSKIEEMHHFGAKSTLNFSQNYIFFLNYTWWQKLMSSWKWLFGFLMKIHVMVKVEHLDCFLAPNQYLNVSQN